MPQPRDSDRGGALRPSGLALHQRLRGPGWLPATTAAKTTFCRLVRIDWDTVGRIITRVMGDKLDPAQLNNLFEIGVDEVTWKRQHHHLTLVSKHRKNQVV